MYFLPPRILLTNMVSIIETGYWSDGNMGAGDPWTGHPYQWTVTFNITPQQHSSHLTPTPSYYTGLDVAVGDWFADLYVGLSVKLVQIISQTTNQVVALCEDVDRFNTFTDPYQQGNGIGGFGFGFIFTLNDEGLPVLLPMTPVQSTVALNPSWAMDQIGRFQYRNYARTFYRVRQPNHGFVVGDVLVLGAAANGSAVYSKVTANTASVAAIVGQVNSVQAPGPPWFTYRPNGRLVSDVSPPLPGQPGDLIYLTQSGLANVAPSQWATPLYIQLETATTAIALSRGIDTAGSLGYASRTYVVPDPPTANTVLAAANAGDQIMVDNSGAGEWTHYIVHQGALRPLSTQDSVRVDAESLEVTITPNTTTQVVVANGVSMNAVLMGNVSANRSVTLVNLQVTAPFSANATISIGTTAASDLVMPAALINLAMLGAYAYTPTVAFSAPYTSVYAFIDYHNTLIGNAIITVSYV